MTATTAAFFQYTVHTVLCNCDPPFRALSWRRALGSTFGFDFLDFFFGPWPLIVGWIGAIAGLILSRRWKQSSGTVDDGLLQVVKEAKGRCKEIFMIQSLMSTVRAAKTPCS
jgi:hypothetical protein